MIRMLYSADVTARFDHVSCSMHAGIQCLNKFLGSEVVEERAAYIGRIIRREKQQILFPDITFTCSGTVHGWVIVMEDRGRDRKRNMYPEVQLWRKQGEQSSYTKVHGYSGLPLSTTNANVYRYSVWFGFQAGDVLGVHQPDGKKSRYNLLFQERGGPTNYQIENENNPLQQFDPESTDVRSNQSDYPLVGLDTSKSNTL